MRNFCFESLSPEKKIKTEEKFQPKEPIRSLPAAANSLLLIGQNTASHLDLCLLYPAGATKLPKGHRRLRNSAKANRFIFHSFFFFFFLDIEMPRSTFLIAILLAGLCCLAFDAEAATGRALLKEKKFNMEELFYGPADASVVAAGASAGAPLAPAPATAPPTTSASASTAAAPAPVAVVVVVSPDSAEKESASSPFVAPADVSTATEPAPAPAAAAASSSASGRRLSEQPEAAAALARAASTSEPLASSSSASARLPPGFIAPSPGDSVANIERGLRKQQGN